MRTCNACGLAKNDDAFYLRNNRRDKTCKDCVSLARKERRKNDPAYRTKMQKYTAAYWSRVNADPEKRAAFSDYRKQRTQLIVDANRGRVVPDGMQRRCWKCKVEQLLVTNFPKNATKPYGYDYICRSCHGLTSRRPQGLHPALVLMLRTYQGGRCAICQRPTKKLCVDHCHTTGEVRGLLCNHCNSLLGFARNDPATLAAAIGYLQNFDHAASPMDLTFTESVVV